VSVTSRPVRAVRRRSDLSDVTTSQSDHLVFSSHGNPTARPSSAIRTSPSVGLKRCRAEVFCHWTLISGRSSCGSFTGTRVVS
jgi:hypothetical protein